MTQDGTSTVEAAHPAPHRNRVGLLTLLFGFFGAHVAWSIHLLVAYPLASHSCYPDGAPRSTVLPGWGWTWPFILALDIVTFGVAVWAGLASYRAWRATRAEHSSNALETGEGRTRFLALCGMLASGAFALIILSDTLVLFLVPLCAY